MNIKGFPDAPPDSYLTDEGWLVIADEAWTQEEWARRDIIGLPVMDEDPDDEQLAKRRYWREHRRRSRERSKGAA